MRGVWAECQGRNATPSRRSKIEEMFGRLDKAGFNTVFMQVYRGNRAWYRSSIADASPYRDFLSREKIDPLRLAINLAHNRGMKLHAWINAFRIWRNRDARAIRKLERKAVTRDSRGLSLLEYKMKSLPDGGYWLDPGDPEARAYLRLIIEEIVERYPDIDGVHLDYTRYPFDEVSNIDFGYGRASVERFKSRHGFDPAGSRGSNRALWDKWRRDQVTAFIRQAREVTSAAGKMLSVATLADMEKSQSRAFQDWPLWLREGLVDFIVPMDYSDNRKIVKKRAEYILKQAGAGGKVAVGLGAYKMLDSPEKLLLQVEDCRKLGAIGVVLFSYDNLTRRPELFSFLGKRVFPAQATKH